VTVPEGKVVLAYAIGPDEGEELPQVVVEVIDVAAADGAAPTAVHSGSGGLAADAGLPLWVAGLMALGAVSLLVPVAATARRRS
jgi:hypothetical protein